MEETTYTYEEAYELGYHDGYYGREPDSYLGHIDPKNLYLLEAYFTGYNEGQETPF